MTSKPGTTLSCPLKPDLRHSPGFLLYQFGYIPKLKDSTEYQGRRFTITHMDRNRIATVLVEKLDLEEQPDPVNEG